METSSPASAAIRWVLDSSAQVRRLARRSCAGVCRSAHLHRNAEASKTLTESGPLATGHPGGPAGDTPFTSRMTCCDVYYAG